MAKIVPYGDLNAHGSLANSLSFRRRFNYVILQKKPFPKQPNSAGQIAQRSAFKTAVSEWYFLNTPTRTFYNTRGAELNMTGQNLYVKQKLINDLPSTTPLPVGDCTNMVINNLRGTSANMIRIECNVKPSGSGLGRVTDNGNVYSDLITVSPDQNLWLHFDRLSMPGVEYQFRDSLSLSLVSGGSPLDILIRFPVIDLLSKSNDDLYISDDGSAYWDIAMTELACVTKF